MEKVPNPKKTNFSATENETLISFIEQNTDLIYPISRTTTDAAERQRMWLKLAKKLNRTPFECKHRWKIIRDYHNKLVRRGEKASKRLSFLERLKSQSRLANSTNHSENNAASMESHPSPAAIVKSEPEASASEDDIHLSHYLEPNVNFEEMHCDNDDLIENLDEHISEQQHTDTIMEIHSDGLRQFFTSLTTTMRHLPELTQLELKRSISKLVYDAEEQYLKDQQQKQLQQCCAHKLTSVKCLDCGYESSNVKEIR